MRDLEIVDDLPAGHLVGAQLTEAHMITAAHTLAHWPSHLYLPGSVIDRKNGESWQRDGSLSLWERAVAEVERRLAGYRPIATDGAADLEMQRLIRGGMSGDCPLPAVPPAHDGAGDPAQHMRRPRIRQRG